MAHSHLKAHRVLLDVARFGRGAPVVRQPLLLRCQPLVCRRHGVEEHLAELEHKRLGLLHCALQHGVTTVDTSVGGLGGCPFAGPGAAGNVATEDVVYMLNGLGVQSGVDFAQVVRAGDFIARTLGRRNSSRAGVASLSRGEVTPMEGI